MSGDAWEQFDALARLVVQVARQAPGWRAAAPLEELMDDLYGRAISASGNAPAPAVTLDDVTGRASSAQAGAAVGYSDRRVRQLASAGLIRAEKHGRDWLVDVDDLHRHCRGESA